jgi:two-component system catabolic regulation response regulator CreB/two-component system response regulator ChvI
MLPETNHGIRKQNKPILIVDDDEDVALTFKKHLDYYGFKSDVFHDPTAVIANFKPGKYALAILDIRMPEISGFELYRKLKRIDSKVKVCFITAFEEYYQSLKEENPDLDVKCFIKKPISRAELFEHIVRELG